MTVANDEPTIDSDALLVLGISIAVLTISLGLFFMVLLMYIVYQAKTSGTHAEEAGSYLVFGKKLLDHGIDQDYQLRLDRLYQMPIRLSFLLGGATGDAQQSEAQAGFDYLMSIGYPTNNLRLEESSRTTLENLKHARTILNKNKYKTAIFISNRYHLTRCSVLAGSLNMPHALCAAEDTLILNRTTVLKCMREAFFLHWFFSGKYWALLTHNQRMLGKIT